MATAQVKYIVPEVTPVIIYGSRNTMCDHVNPHVLSLMLLFAHVKINSLVLKDVVLVFLYLS